MVGGASKPATVARIYDLCGPTYPGQLDAGAQAYVVQYPGVVFLFPAPAGQGCLQELPPEPPGTAGSTADRLCIFAGSAGESMRGLSAVIMQIMQLGRGIPVPSTSRTGLPPGDAPRAAWHSQLHCRPLVHLRGLCR